MLGDDLLVAPILAGEKSRNVRLPKGKWYDYKTGALVGYGQTITVSPTLADIPLFVREGRAIPTAQNPAPNLAHVSPTASYLLRCYGHGPWQGALYEDRGDGYGYETGEFGLFDLKVSDNGVKATANNREGTGTAISRPFSVLEVGKG